MQRLLLPANLPAMANFAEGLCPSLCARLAVGPGPGPERKQALIIESRRVAHSNSVLEEGFCTAFDYADARRAASQPSLSIEAEEAAYSSALAEKIGSGIKRLVALGLPATLILLYDESWEMIDFVAPLLHSCTGNECNLDVCQCAASGLPFLSLILI